MKKVLIDTDIIMDLFSKREPFFHYSAELFSLIDIGNVHGFVSALIFPNLFYILCKQISIREAKNALLKLKVLTSVLPVDEKIIDLALSSNLKDFEDAIQYCVAMKNKINIIITRNTKDYAKADIEAMTAKEYLKSFKL
jgi:predicted nucleic acid-binding protein